MGRKEQTMKKIKLSLTSRRALTGYLFILPFLLGFIFLFLTPMIQSIRFSFNEIQIIDNGYKLVGVGLKYYKKALTIDPVFNRLLIESVGSMLLSVPIIIIFSLFVASILNQKFAGRTLARAIFFLPVIVATSVVAGDFLMEAQELDTLQVEQFSQAAQYLINLLSKANINMNFIMYIVTAVENIYSIINASGIQIIIFLAGLQSISPSVYEAASMEGATSWESFWKITFPIISPLIIVNVLYSIIDTFTKNNNEIMLKIREAMVVNLDYGYSSAMSWIHSVAIVVFLYVIILTISKRVFYYE